MKAIIYTKVCLPCVFKNKWALVQGWAVAHDVDLQVRRTTYNPIYHKMAVNAYGGDKYLAFAKIKDATIDLARLAEMIEVENIEEENNDLRELLRAKKSTRKGRVLVAKKKTRKKDEKKR